MAHALYLAVPVLVLPAPTLANRAYLGSYARTIANLLQMGGPTAFTQISVRIPISDPTELIHQGPANVSPNPANLPTPPLSAASDSAITDKTASDRKHKRMSSMSTRPVSMHQGNNTLPVFPPGMRTVSGASAASGTSGMSAFSGVSGTSMMSARSSSLPAFARGDPSSTWEMWDAIRKMCDYHPRLSVSAYRSPLQIQQDRADASA